MGSKGYLWYRARIFLEGPDFLKRRVQCFNNKLGLSFLFFLLTNE